MPRARVSRDLGRLVFCKYGTTNNMDFGSHAAYRVGSDDSAAGGAIAFWFRALTATGTPSRRLALIYTANNWVGLYMASTEGSDKSAIVAEFVKAGGGIAGISGSTGIRYTDGKLHHVVLTWNGSGAEMWLDGVLVWSAVGDARPTFGATPNLVLGNNNAYDNPANAEVGGECCLFARKLGRGEIERLYFAGESPETPAACWGPRGWDPGGASGGTIALTAGSGNAGTVTNGTTMPERAERTARRRTRGRGALRISPSSAGQSAGWQVADTAALKPQSFTIEARLRFDNAAGGYDSNYRGFVTKTTGISWNDGWGLVEVSNANGRLIRMWVGSYGNGTTYLLAPSAREVHVVGTYNFVSGLAQMFVEGALVAAWNAGAGLAQAAVPVRIGHGYSGAGGYTMRGTIRDVRYYSRVLSALEVQQRAENDEEIESGIIEAWQLDEAPVYSNATPLASMTARGRIAGLNATWSNDATAADFEGSFDAAKIVKAVASRWRQAKGGNTARSAIDASLKPGSGSFSVAITVRLFDGQNSSNIVLTANDGVSYANGWALNFQIAADGASHTLSAYVNSGGPTVSTSTVGQRVIPRHRTARWVIVADAVSQTVSMYVDGQIFAKSGIVSWNIANNPFLAVGWDPAIGFGPGMQVGDVQYAVGKAWTADEIANDARGVPDSLSGVTHAWPMDEKSGTSFRATKGGVPLSTIAGTFVEPLSALSDAPRRQNRWKYSEQFNNAAWTKNLLTVSADALVAPDGSTTGDTLTDSADGAPSQHYLDQAPANVAANVADGTIVVASVYAKAGTKSVIGIAPNGAAVGWTFDVSAGTPGALINGAPIDKGIEPAGNGWFRCWVKYAHSSSAGVRIYMATSTASVVYQGNGSGTIGLWGAQVSDADLSGYLKTEDGVEIAPADRYPPQAIDTFEQRCWLLTMPSDAVVDGSNFVLSAPGRAPGNRGWTQATSSKRPQVLTGGLDGHPYFNFDGGDALQASAAFATDLSTATARADWLIAAVIDPSSASGSQAIFDSFESSSADRILVTQSGYATPGKASWYDGTWREPANSVTGPQLVIWDLRAGRGRFLRNAIQVGPEYVYSRRMMADLSVALGGNFDAGSGYFVGKIYFAAVIKNPTDADLLATIDFARERFPSLALDPDQ